MPTRHLCCNVIWIAAVAALVTVAMAEDEGRFQDSARAVRHLEAVYGTVTGTELWEGGAADAQQTLVGYSALLDPVKEIIEVFFDASHEARDYEFSCLFYQESLTEEVQPTGGHKVDGKLIETDHAENLDVAREHVPKPELAVSTGFMLECNAPSSSPQTVALRYKDAWTRLPIEKISTTYKGSVGACVGPFYSDRKQLIPWLAYHYKLGVQNFYLYSADWTVDHDLEGASGIFDSDELRAAAPVRHIGSSYAEWLVFRPSAVRYYAGQSTCYSECVARQRYRHDYLMFIDVDELLHIRDQGPEQPLEAFLDAQMPKQASVMSILRFMYPKRCCQHTAAGAIDYTTCTKRDELDHHVGKSIVRPALVKGMSTHQATAVQAGTQWFQPPPEQILLKHVKLTHSWGLWSVIDCALLVDDSNI